MLDGFRFRAGVAVVLLGATGILEGVALLALIPALSAALPNEDNLQAVNQIRHVMRFFAIPEEYIVHAGLTLFLVFGLSSALSRLLGEASILRIRTKVEEVARASMAEALLRMSWSRYLSLRVGDISKAMLVEGAQMGTGVHLFLQGVGAILVAICYLGIAMAISVKMTMFALLFGLFGGAAYHLGWKGSHRHTKELSHLNSTIGTEVNNIFGSLKYFRATGRAREVGAKAHDVYRHYANTYFWSQVFGNLMRFGFEVGAMVFVAVFLVLAILVYSQPIISALIFLAVFYRLAPRLLTVQESFFHAKTYLPWYETWRSRLSLARSSEEKHRGKQELASFEEVYLKNVTFQYDCRTFAVLRRVNLRVQRGQCVAIVGPSGSGKSTIVDLVTGLLTPTAGMAEVNGIDLKRISLDSWRRKIGLVLQESPLFYGSVLENIAWGAGSPDRGRVECAARLSHAWEFIQSLPNGLDTLVGERGGMLSGGQRQRIALARALYQEPWLLILDEATSALDGHSEAVILDALESLKGSCAIILVAHRLKTVEIADQIAVLQEGRIVEEGAWSELAKYEEGVFRKMAELQGMDIEAA